MNNLNHVIYETRFPNTNDRYYSSLEDKNLYLKEYMTYNRFLLLYLINNTSLKQYDDMLVQNKDYILTVPEEENQDMYQFLCNDMLTYFYIRNNLYMENLSPEEKAFLDSKLDSEIVYDKEVEDFIKNTYKKVILVKRDGIDDKTNINFGPGDNRDFYVKNGSLIIGMRTDLYVKKDEADVKKKFFEGLHYLRDLTEELKNKMNEELSFEVNVIQYDDQSVKKLNFMDKSILGK